MTNKNVIVRERVLVVLEHFRIESHLIAVVGRDYDIRDFSICTFTSELRRMLSLLKQCACASTSSSFVAEFSNAFALVLPSFANCDESCS